MAQEVDRELYHARRRRDRAVTTIDVSAREAGSLAMRPTHFAPNKNAVDLALSPIYDTIPKRGTLWRHYKGGLYAVLGADFVQSEWRAGRRPIELHHYCAVRVIYMAIDGVGEVWIRNLTEWHETVEVGGMKLPRFQHFSGGE